MYWGIIRRKNWAVIECIWHYSQSTLQIECLLNEFVGLWNDACILTLYLLTLVTSNNKQARTTYQLVFYLATKCMDLITLFFNTTDLINTYLLERRFENRGTLHFRKIKFIVRVKKLFKLLVPFLVFYSIDIHSFSRSSSHS